MVAQIEVLLPAFHCCESALWVEPVRAVQFLSDLSPVLYNGRTGLGLPSKTRVILTHMSHGGSMAQRQEFYPNELAFLQLY